MLRFLIISILVFFSFSLKSQVLVDNVNDAKSFLQAYLNPLGNGLGAITNNGWYNTARPHKLLGFDATVSLSFLNISNEKKSFNPNSISNFSSSSTLTPTILGKGNGATVEYQGEEFKLPNQSPLFSILALPNLNLGLGIFKKTEINGRFIPNYKYDAGFIGKGEINMWGVGFKHDLLQWIPVIGNTIPLSLSLQAAHTQMTSKISILDQPVNMDIQATNINLIISKNILMVCGYASIGYNSSSTTFRAGENITNSNSLNLDELEITLPIEMEFETVNELRANIGLKLTLAVITVSANHTISEYPVTTIGVGASLR
ncbi:hypothetical protein OAJ32_01885 [bacterium]|nr:hypothetical protein [bacterium]